jgi:hypothetical protein
VDLGTYSEAATEFEVIPADKYTVRLDNIEVKPKLPQYVEEGKDDQQWMWSFSINDGPMAGKTFKAWSNRTVNRGSTAKMWVEALLGRNLVDGEPVTAEDILDKTMDIYLGVKVSETSGKSFNRIKDVIVRVPAPALPTLTQELEAPSANPGEALGYPRRIAAARMALKKAGILDEDMDHRQAKVVGHPGKFRELETADKKLVVDWFEAWAEDWEAENPEDRGQIYDRYGEMQF